MAPWAGNIARSAFITFVGMVTVLAYAVLRLGTLFIFDADKRRHTVRKIRGRLLRLSMTVLGATFIKLGQVMSTRPDLFPPEIIAELRLLQDQLPPFAFRRVQASVEADLKGPITRFFQAFDTTPVAAASVAQVHHAVLTDGREVAVKVLRPNVRRTVERDAAILLSFARLFAINATLRQSDPVGHLHYFVQGIIAQTDLRLEATNYEVFRKNFADFPHLSFPAVHSELCGEHVMTMDFCRGRKIDNLGDGDHSKTAETIRNCFFKMCFDDGFMHADLHPGNMLVTEDGDVIVFDVGLALSIDDALLAQFVDFARCISFGTGSDFVNHLRSYHQYMDNVDWDAIGKDAEAFVQSFRRQNVSELEWSELINDVFGLARRHNIRPVPEMALVLVGVVTAEGLGKQLNPNGNSFQEMAQFLMPILARRGMLNSPVPLQASNL